MATTITKLFPTGILQTGVALDEISLTAGSISFNGTTQYLTAPSSSSFILGAVFTIEAWIYIAVGSQIQGIVSSSDNTQWSFGLNATNKLQFRATSTTNDITGATTLATGVWYHCAVVMSGTGASQTTLYVNGILDGSGTIPAAYSTQVGVNIASGRNAGSNTFNGNIANVRIVNSTAVYTANFTPVRSILPAITNTVLLLNVTDSANFIKDNGLNKITLTNIATSTFSTNSPYITGTEKIKISTNAVNSLLFDETSLSTSTAERRTSTGTYLVSRYFDEWTLPNSPALYYSSTNIATSTATSYTLPGTVQAGDLIVLFGAVGDSNISTNPGITGPAGYTSIFTDWSSSNATVDADAYGWWYKIASSADASSVVTYTSPDTNAQFRNSAIYLFRNGVPITAVSTSSVNSAADKNVTSATTPSAQTVTPGRNFPVIIFGNAKASSGTASLNLNGATSTITVINSQASSGFAIPSDPGTTTVTASITRSGGNCTYLASFYLALS